RTWVQIRRPEIVGLYETDIFGRIPKRTAKVTWRTSAAEPAAAGATEVVKRIIGTVGDRPDGPHIRLTLHTPSAARQPVPIILVVGFGGGASPAGGDPPVAAEILARGWGYAVVAYQDIQPDRADAWDQGVIGATRALSGGRSAEHADDRAKDEWGDISAWAWG